MIVASDYDNEALDVLEDDEEVVKPSQSTTRQQSVTSDRQESVPLLFGAIHAGNLDDVRILLDQTVEFIDSSSYGGLTPLHAACHMQQLDIMKLLISRGAKVSAFDSLGNSVLHCAVTEKWHDGVKELLHQGASPKQMNESPRGVSGILMETPLHAAVRLEDKISITMLLKYEPDLKIRDSKNSSVFHLAASTKNVSILKLLLVNKDSLKHLKEMEDDGYTMYHAVLSGDVSVEDEPQILKVIQAVHKVCEDVNQVDLLGETPLIKACRAGLPNVVKFLLANGADPTHLTRERQSTLHAACSSGCSITLRHLLSTGRVGHLITCTNNDGYHPFFFAVQSASADCCKVLLDNGEHLAHVGKNGISNCTLVIEQLPSAIQLLRGLFDSCVKLSKKPQQDPNFSITFNYSALMSLEKGKMQCSIVSELAGTPLESLIKHPLLESFLFIKWCRIRRIFYFNVIQFFIYLLMHTVFVMTTFGHDPVDWLEYPEGLRTFKIIHFILLLLIFVPGVIVTYANYKKYLLQWETYTRFVALMSSAVVIFLTSGQLVAELSTDETTPSNITTNTTTEHQVEPDLEPELAIERVIASISMFFGWVELMMLLGRFPALGAYVLMFTRVAKSVIKFLLSFLCLLIGFALSFHIIFQQVPVFADFKLSFVKTLMMMTGELAYSEFVLQEGMPLPTYSLIVLSMFLFMVTVVMSNLLIGLAVNDIPDLKRQGKIKRLVKQASYLMAYEKLLEFAYSLKYFPRKLRSFLLTRCNIKPVLTIVPNKERRRHKFMQIIPDETIREAITLGSCENPEDFPTEPEEDINLQMKAFHIRYSSDRRTQKHKFSDLNEVCNNIKKQMDQLQYKFDSQLSHLSMQLQQQLQQNQNLYNQISQNQSGESSKQQQTK